MIKNYLKLAFRNVAKNRLSSAINILGLSLAVGCCLVVFKFFDFSLHMDEFNSKINNLFVIERITNQKGIDQYWGDSPSALGPMLRADFPQVKNIARLNYEGVVFKQGDNVFKDNVTFADNSFYKMFDFPVKWGNKKNFTGPEGIVLTEELSEKLFGKENSIGKNVGIIFGKKANQVVVNFTVKGVLAKQPNESSFYFSALIPFTRMSSLGIDNPGDWKQSSDITFIEAPSEASLEPMKRQGLKKYTGLYNAANPDAPIIGYNFQPLNSMSFHAYKVKNVKFAASHIAAFIMLLVIGIFTLILVYFNYMNIAIASASSRLKEIGIRKVMGSKRKQIIFQFILENVLLCAIAVGIGLLLAKFIFLPLFGQMANLDLSENLFNNYRIWLALLALTLISAISGSAYPAFYISAFKPVSIMNGNRQMGSNNRFRKGLLAFQFFLTFLTISIAFAFIHETKLIKTKPWGYDPANTVVVLVGKTLQFEAFKNELTKNEDVISVTGSVQPLGTFSKQMLITADGSKQRVNGLSVIPGFAKQLGITIAKGRDLDAQFETDKTNSVLVNQTFLKQMRWSTGIGKTIKYENHTYQIVGEVNDFHFENFLVPVSSLVLIGCNNNEIKYAYIKTKPGMYSSSHKQVEKAWKTVYANLPFDYYYQQSVFDGYFNGFTQISQILIAASFIMIIISITGIFGLALLIIGKKMKEISVRKVLGAGMANIIYLINKEFIFAIGCAVLIGIPFSLWMTRNLFNAISPESKVSFAPLSISLISLFFMTAISVSWHIYRANTANPTDYLKEQ